jgi:hypothetical protein
MKSAMAEELILALALKDPALLDNVGMLTGAHFSVPLLGNVFTQLHRRQQEHLEVSVGVLEDLTQEEMSHIVGICQKQDGPVSEQAFRDCIRTVLSQNSCRSGWSLRRLLFRSLEASSATVRRMPNFLPFMLQSYDYVSEIQKKNIIFVYEWK